MSRLLTLALLAACFSFIFFAPLAFAQYAPSVNYYYCQLSPKIDRTHIYFSTAFATPELRTKKVSAGFSDYVTGKYSKTGYVGCPDFHTLAEAESELKRNETLESNAQNNKKVIETGWKYGMESNSSSIPASAASVEDTGRHMFHFCKVGGATRTEWGAQPRVIPMPLYISDIYPVPMDRNIQGADSTAFAQFVGGKYDPFLKTATRSCGGNFTNLEDARAGKQKLEDTYRNNARVSPHTFPNPNIIETGWKWDGH